MLARHTDRKLVPFWNKKRKRLLFYTCMMALPVTQVLIFYFGVNLNSLLLAFQKYDVNTGTMQFAFLENFKRVFTGDNGNATSEILYGIRNSLLAYFIGLAASLGLGVPFANAIYKRVPGSGLFKVILYLPQVLSLVVMSIIYMNFTEEAVPQLLNDLFHIKIASGPLSARQPSAIFAGIMFFNVFMGFGTNMLMYTGAMSSVSPSTKEAAKVDGANAWQEFIHVTVPSVWPTMCTLITVGIAGIFVNQLNLFTFYNTGATVQVSSLGYYIYKATYRANQAANPNLQFPYLSAFGIIMTLFAAPLTLGMRKLLEKVGPRPE